MILAADNLNSTDWSVSNAIDAMDPEPIVNLVFQCERAGAEAIDINPGKLLQNQEEKMKFLVEAVQSVSGLPIILDIADPKALEAGLKASQNPAIINGFSLEPARLAHILPLANNYNADIIGYLLYPDGHVPASEEDIIQTAIQLHKTAAKAGIDDGRLIIDPVVVPLAWGNAMKHNQNILNVIRRLPGILGFSVRTIAGISNLTSGPGPAGRKFIAEQAFIPMLAAAGLTIALFNILRPDTARIARMSHTLINSAAFSWAEMS